MRRVDMVVVGSGVVGAATAWWASRLGLDVVVLERFEAGHARGSSHGGVRIFRLAYPQADYVELARQALDLWRELEDHSGDTLLEITGGIDFGFEGGVRATAEGLATAGVPGELLTAEAATERFAGFSFSGPVLFQPQAGRCWAQRSVAALLRVAAAGTAEVHFEEPVERIRPVGDEAEILTAQDTYRTPLVVVAAGAWAADVLHGLVALPTLRVTREQPAHFAPIDATTEWPSFIEHSPDSSFVTYGLFEPGVGLKVGEHLVGPEVHPDRRSFEPDPIAVARLVDHVRGMAPGVHPDPVAVDTCLYTSTANEDFVIDRVGPITVASACSGHGFKFGPATGRLVAEVALGHRPTLPRFALPR